MNPAFAASYADYTVTWPDGTATTVDDNFLDHPEKANERHLKSAGASDPYGCEPVRRAA